MRTLNPTHCMGARDRKKQFTRSLAALLLRLLVRRTPGMKTGCSPPLGARKRQEGWEKGAGAAGRQEKAGGLVKKGQEQPPLGARKRQEGWEKRAGGSSSASVSAEGAGREGSRFSKGGVQWKQGVVIYIMSCAASLHSAAPIHCTPLPLHPPLLNTQGCVLHSWRAAVREDQRV